MWVFVANLVFAFPCVLRSSLGVPANFNNGDAVVFQLFDLPIHDLHGFFRKDKIVVELNLFPRDNKRFIGQAFLKVRYMEGVVYSAKFFR